MTHRIGIGVTILLFWTIAALLVIGVDRIPLKLAAIVICAFAYMKLFGRTATLDHALFVGMAWLLLDIVAEMSATHTFGSGWFRLTGSPTTPMLRSVMFFGWIAAPALFARCDT